MRFQSVLLFNTYPTDTKGIPLNYEGERFLSLPPCLPPDLFVVPIKWYDIEASIELINEEDTRRSYDGRARSLSLG